MTKMLQCRPVSAAGAIIVSLALTHSSPPSLSLCIPIEAKFPRLGRYQQQARGLGLVFLYKNFKIQEMVSILEDYVRKVAGVDIRPKVEAIPEAERGKTVRFALNSLLMDELHPDCTKSTVWKSSWALLHSHSDERHDVLRILKSPEEFKMYDGLKNSTHRDWRDLPEQLKQQAKTDAYNERVAALQRLGLLAYAFSRTTSPPPAQGIVLGVSSHVL